MKQALIISLAITLLIFAACSKKTNEPQKVNTQDSLPKTEVPSVNNQNIKQPENQTVTAQDKLKLLSEGKIDNFEFTIGIPTKEVIKKWGQPQRKDFFTGGLYLDYGKVVLFTDSIDENLNDNGKVVRISPSKDISVFGVREGMTFDEIKKVLGQPNYIEYVPEDGSELFGGNWIMEYTRGQHYLTFVTPDKIKPTIQVHID